jgi:Hep_Hag.
MLSYSSKIWIFSLFALAITLGVCAQTVRVIDNKGTIKELTAGSGIGFTNAGANINISSLYDGKTILLDGSSNKIYADNTAAYWNANQLQGINISTAAPTNGQILGYDGSTSKWTPISPSTYAWLLTGNGAITVPAIPATYGTTTLSSSNNWIGTTDANKDFIIGTNSIERLRVTSSGNIGVGITSGNNVNSNYLITVNPNSVIGNGISMNLSGVSGTVYGLNINTGTSAANGILFTSTSTGSGFYGIGSVLSNTNIVSGYLGYRNGSGVSYGLYGINGTSGTYATASNTYAAFLQGRTVISSESAPSSPVGVDLEIRNTSSGPPTLSMRQSTSNATSGTSLAKINFGDNYSASDVPQAQIQAIRDAAGGVSNDLPTALIFSTTPDGSATIAERMRISNAGNVGIGTTSPSTLLHINSSSPAFRLVDGTQGTGKILTSDVNGNASWSGISSIGSISLSTGTASTAPAWSVSPVSLGGSTQLNIPMANTTGVTAGLISNTDWNTFNSKIGNVTGSSPITVTIAGTTANVSVGYDNSTIKVNGSNQLYAVNNGTVTNFSAGDLSPLFTTTEATTTTTPALSFALSNAPATTIFGNNTGASAAPSYFSSGNLSVAGDVTGTLGTTTVARIQNIPVKSGTPSNGQILAYNSATSQWEPMANGGSGWLLAGNAGTTPGTNFLGTTDNQALVFKVNGIQSGYLGTSNTSQTSFGYNANATTWATGATAIGANAQASNNYATALGGSSTAIGGGVAIGYGAQANGMNSIAIGGGDGTIKTAVTNNNSIAIGYNTAAGFNATAIGSTAQAVQNNNTAVGYGALANTTQNATALGSTANASGQNSTAIGYGVKSPGYQSMAIGYAATGSGQSAVAVGDNSTASGYLSTAVGTNTQATAQNATAIGNGTIANTANTVILGNGANVGIGTSNPQNKLEITQGTAGYSGLRFTNLTSASTGSATNTSPQTLTVDGSGNVIMNNGLSYVNNQNGTNYTIATTDNQAIIYFTSASAVTVNVPNSLPAGFTCSIIQGGSGQLTFAGTGLNNTYGQYKSASQYASITIQTPVVGINVLSGQTIW